VTNHGHDGIGIGYARRVNVANNKVTQNGGASTPKTLPPVQLSASSTNVRGFGIGLSCDAYDNKVSSNEVFKNTNYGILIDISFNNQITRNAVSESETGIQLFGAYGNVIEANKVRLNSGFGIRLERGTPRNAPSVSNLLYGNDLDANRINAFDTSGKDRAPPQVPAGIQPKASTPLPADLSAPNRWDNGTIGNHYSDFDKKEQGFVDDNGDGIGERAHPIPGGSAVDHLPLTAERVLQAQTKSDLTHQLALVETICGVPQSLCDGRTPAGHSSCPPRL
jgi:parallel beta-helix repeat protein